MKNRVAFPLMLGALLGTLGATRAASAQVHLDHPAVEACAEQIYAAVRPLGRERYRRWEILPTIYAGLRRASACRFPEAVREAMRLDALELGLRTRRHLTPAEHQISREASEALAPLVATPRASECDHGDHEGLYTECMPVPIPIRELNVGTRPRFLMSSPRLFLVQIVDAVAEADPRLMASAQLLWMYASWMNCECVPSITFLWMRRDLREGRVRLAAYPDERLETSDESEGVALFPDDTALGEYHRPFRHDSHPVHLSPGM
ncbi:MAG: hypothetical protein GXP55_23120 [Deltaproteobacteria bacterium]|nr:hypothetical protein [Deltaproteobacteria bacterium]